jgi:hypothetical protein
MSSKGRPRTRNPIHPDNPIPQNLVKRVIRPGEKLLSSLSDEDLSRISEQNLKLIDKSTPKETKQNIDVSGLKNLQVRNAAAMLATRLEKIQSGVSQGQVQGLKELGSIQVKDRMETLFKLADQNNDPDMLNTLLEAISFEGKKSPFDMTSADDRARVRAAQLFKALEGDGSYAQLKQNIANLSHDAKTLRTMASDPSLLQLLDKRKYADANKLLVAVEGSDYKVASQHREWYLDQAVLMEAYRSLEGKGKDAAATQKQLALIMLHSFGKAAPLGEVEFEMQSTPFYNTPSQYYRSTAGNTLVQRFCEDLAAKIGVPQMEIHLLDNQRFKEILARAYPLAGVKTRVASQQEFEASLDEVFAQFAQAQNKGTPFPPLTMEVSHIERPQPIIFDVTGIYEGRKLTPKELRDQMKSDLEKVFLDKAEAFLSTQSEIGGHSETHELTIASSMVDAENFAKAFAEKVMRNVRIGAFTREGGVDMLITPQFLGGTKGTTASSEKRQKLLDDAKPAGPLPATTVLAQSIKQTIVETGYRPDMIRLKELWLDLKTPGEILAKNNIPIQITQLATSSKPAPKVVESFKKFVEQPLYKDFAALENDPQAKPFLKVLPGATIDLLNGLTKYKPNDGGIDKAFADKNLTEVLQTSYFRIANAMQSAIHRKDDLIPVCNAIETINQELAMILEVVQPNARNSFSDSIRAAMTASVAGAGEHINRVGRKGEPTIPPGLNPALVHLKPSSMHCLASVASSVEALTGRNDLNVCILRDNYYEGVGALSNSKTYKLSILNGDKLGSKDHRLPLDPKDLAGKVPLDLYVCDFHHNISIDRTHYRVEDLQHQVDELFRNKLVGPKFTVALDCTIDYINSPDVQSFLKHNEQRIADGDLNVVLYRSAQKFDMFGLDNYYGGFSVTLNKNSDYTSFNKRMDADDDQLEGLARQGLSHVAVNAAPRMDQYRKALMDSTKRIYDALPKECLYSPTSTSPIQISTTDDPNAVFLDIKFPGNPKAFGEFNTKIKEFVRQNKLPMTERASFGFVTTNYNFIAGSKCRLTPGLEGPEIQQKYVDFFKAVTKCVNDAAIRGAQQGLEHEDLNKYIAAQLSKMPVTTVSK